MTADSSPRPGAPLIDRIAAGEFPKEFLLVAARGLLPIEQDELVGVLTYLSDHSDPEVSAAATEALNEVPTKAIVAFVRGGKASGEQLGRLAAANDDPSVTEAILRSRNAPDETIIAMARRADPTLQEVIVVNQERLLQAPAILEALLANPLLSLDIRRRVLEFRHEFFEKKRPERPAPEEEEEPEDLSPIADLLAKAAEIPEPSASTMPDMTEDPADQPVIIRLLKMSVAERVQRAFRGGRTERSILVRDRNRLVCTAVLRSPRISDLEVEQFAALRNVDEEVLRQIGVRREWTTKHGIALALCRNPKAPLGVVLPLVNRLTLRDLKELARDKNIQEGVRLSARKLFLARSKT